MLKAVLCDLDGTLLDSNELHAAAWQRTFENFGYHVTFDEVLHQIGKGGDQLIPVFVPEKDRERMQKPIEEFRKNLFHAEYFDKITAFPDARELLLRMRERGLRIAIASSASKQGGPGKAGRDSGHKRPCGERSVQRRCADIEAGA